MDISDISKSEQFIISINDKFITCRLPDGYFNATQLCSAGGKSFGDWYANKSSNKFLDELSIDINIDKTSLILFEDTNNSKTKTTWVHPRVIINIAQWISVKFNVKISKCIHEMMVFGDASKIKIRSNEEIMEEQIRQIRMQLEQEYAEKLKRTEEIIIKDYKEEICFLREKLEITEQKFISVLDRTIPLGVPLNQQEIFVLVKKDEHTYEMIGKQLSGINKMIRDGKFKEEDIIMRIDSHPNTKMLKTIVRNHYNESSDNKAKVIANTIHTGDNYPTKNLIKRIHILNNNKN